MSPTVRLGRGKLLLIAAGISFAAIVGLRLAVVHPDSDGPEVVYPGSTLTSRVVYGPDVRYSYVANASTDEVLQFFLSEFRRRGYDNAVGASTPSTLELFACGWQRNGMVTRLGFIDPDEIKPPSAGALAYRVTVHPGAVLVGNRPCNKLLPGDPPPPS